MPGDNAMFRTEPHPLPQSEVRRSLQIVRQSTETISDGLAGHVGIPRSLGRVLATLLVAWSLAAGIHEVRAEDWMFRRSYFTHTPPEGVQPEPWLPRSRSAYRTAYYGEIPSLSFRSEFRINNRVLRNGPRTDHSIQSEGFIQIQP
ncbi:MAG: hypothetical protein C0478_12925 [Planctomyces sp.]|nr:hypothetical protein [Planctomyces sp.]